jgi:hypothetical protein
MMTHHISDNRDEATKTIDATAAAIALLLINEQQPHALVLLLASADMQRVWMRLTKGERCQLEGDHGLAIDAFRSEVNN